MSSFDFRHVALAAALAIAWARPARAQGFALVRLDPAPAGAGWLVMDSLDMHGKLAGAASLTVSYARDPLTVVSDQATADIGMSASFDRFRVSLDLPSPLAIKGPDVNVDLGHDPDVVMDARVGFDVRFFGAPLDPLRLGWSARLFFPNGQRESYETDGSMRGLFRLLFAGDLPFFTYAGHVGIHVRRVDEFPTPDAAAGDELVLGAAAGVRLAAGTWAVIVGPEFFGETALAHASGSTTGVEALLSARLEDARRGGLRLRVKLGGGGGLDPHFGAPAWRLVTAVELFQSP